MSDAKTNKELISETRARGDALIADIAGDIDLHNSVELRTALLEILGKQQPKRLILNLSQVPYMDSSAIAVLVETLQRLRKVGARMALIDLQPRVRGLFEIARLDTLFLIAANEEEALSK